jgi:hypothetical protein
VTALAIGFSRHGQDVLRDLFKGCSARRTLVGVFKKQGVYWLDYYVDGHRKRERVGTDKRLAETVLHKYEVEI